ncbi:uncharacterized protein PAC_15420 [Phialocephala subalpina]|uniref:Uncharacterized protein n=1 Tax=Phialocephala subalpina TaxID=576137 RepID=A0A1L7XKD8_9HELO|nr:uncharacterized protein PAC_15420 [Phialocephala subalpina]
MDLINDLLRAHSIKLLRPSHPSTSFQSPPLPTNRPSTRRPCKKTHITGTSAADISRFPLEHNNLHPTKQLKQTAFWSDIRILQVVGNGKTDSRHCLTGKRGHSECSLVPCAPDAADITSQSGSSKNTSLPASPLLEYDEISNWRLQISEPCYQQPGLDKTQREQGPQAREVVKVSQDSGVCPTVEEQTSQAQEERISIHKLATIAAIVAYDRQMSQGNEENPPPERFEFELQYGLSSTTFRGILEEILGDLITSKFLHNWDEKLFKGPLKAILKVVHMSWGLNSCTPASLIAHSTVEEIFSNAANTATSSIQEAGDIGNYLFFTKVGDDPYHKLQYLMLIHLKRNSDKGARPSSSTDSINTLNLAQGRIVYVKDRISYLERLTLLILYLFCLRLQDEDYGFIRSFIEKHLSMRCGLKFPYHWQETSPPEIDSSRQKCYKRVTLSWHISYLTLSTTEAWKNTESQIDHVRIFPFHHHRDPAKSGDMFLDKASSSVLLTLCAPEESKSREEGVCLSQTPQALWAVLVFNCATEFVSDQRARQYLTPIAQYVRGITSTICT